MAAKKSKRLEMVRNLEGLVKNDYNLQELYRGLEKTPVVLVKNPSSWDMANGRVISHLTYIGRVNCIGLIPEKEIKKSNPSDPNYTSELIGKMFAMAFDFSDVYSKPDVYNIVYDIPALTIRTDSYEKSRIYFEEDGLSVDISMNSEFVFGPAAVRRNLSNMSLPAKAQKEVNKYLELMGL